MATKNETVIYIHAMEDPYGNGSIAGYYVPSLNIRWAARFDTYTPAETTFACIAFVIDEVGMMIYRGKLSKDRDFVFRITMKEVVDYLNTGKKYSELETKVARSARSNVKGGIRGLQEDLGIMTRIELTSPENPMVRQLNDAMRSGRVQKIVGMGFGY